MDRGPSPSEAFPRRPRIRDRPRLPTVSGKVSAFALIVCFALTAVLIPMAAHIPASFNCHGPHLATSAEELASGFPGLILD